MMKYLTALAAAFSAMAQAVALPSAGIAPLADAVSAVENGNNHIDIDARTIPQPRHVFQSHHLDARQALTNSTKPPANATVELCSEPQFEGECVNSTWPINTCISLNGYAGHVASIEPKSGFECLLTQGRCDVAVPYVSAGSDPADTAGDDLSNLPWIGNSSSYICFQDMEILRRYVRMRLRTPMLREADVADVQAREEPSFDSLAKRALVKMWTWASGVLENLRAEEARVRKEAQQ